MRRCQKTVDACRVRKVMLKRSGLLYANAILAAIVHRERQMRRPLREIHSPCEAQRIIAELDILSFNRVLRTNDGVGE